MFNKDFCENNNTETLLGLKKLAQPRGGSNSLSEFGYNYDDCLVAVKALIKNYKDDPETLPFIKNIAESDYFPGEDYYYYFKCSDFRRAVVREVAQVWNNDSNTLLWLKNLAQSDDNFHDFSIRVTAVQEVARGWKNDSETLSWLKNIAKSHFSYQVRITAVQEVARGWKNNPKTLPWLKDNFWFKDNWVYPYLLQEIVLVWKDEPETLFWLKNLAQSNNYAAEALLKWLTGKTTILPYKFP